MCSNLSIFPLSCTSRDKTPHVPSKKKPQHQYCLASAKDLLLWSFDIFVRGCTVFVFLFRKKYSSVKSLFSREKAEVLSHGCILKLSPLNEVVIHSFPVYYLWDTPYWVTQSTAPHIRKAIWWHKEERSNSIYYANISIQFLNQNWSIGTGVLCNSWIA